VPTNGTVVSTSVSGYTVTGNIKWTATTSTDGYKGQVKADLLVGTTHYLSEPISVTIKSIKDQTATFTGLPSGSPWNLSACESGTLNLEAGNMYVPGTGNIFPEQVNSFAWLVPKGWTINGWTSPDGATWKITSPNVTVTYPKSDISGSIKVKASYLTACGDVQESKESAVITVNRSVSITITANKSYILCGDVTPITYTVTPALPCALYYWNNSQTPTTSNSFQFTPDGHSPVNVTVTIVYGTSTQTKTHTMSYVLFAPGVIPTISGSPILCSGNYSYSVSNLRPGYTVNWTYSSNLQLVSNIDNVITLSPNGNGTGSISASVISNCGSVPVTQITLWIGAPTVPSSIVGFCCNGMEFGSESIYYFTVHANNQGLSQYNWIVGGGTILEGQGTETITVKTAKVTGSQRKYFDVSVRVANECNSWSGYLWRTGYVTSGVGPALFTVYPNPATTKVSVSVSDVDLLSATETSNNILIKSIKVMDSNGNSRKIKRDEKGSKSVTVNVSDLEQGIYFMLISDGVTEESHKLLIEK
jgi:hypothetical protein